jgi:tetratricopeptide (TPR) repeat protein
MIRRLVQVSLVIGLATSLGCAGKPEPGPEAPTEQQSLDRSARLAFGQGNYAQAATLYEAALQSALTEDAPGAIIDARFNLALSQTYLGDYEAALEQVAKADAERRRRGLGADPQLELLAGTIHYRAGQTTEAQALLARVLESPGAQEATRAKAHFVAGLIAADQGSIPVLKRELAALFADAGHGQAVDRLELEGRPAGLEGDVDAALDLLDQVAAARRMQRDYRGMVRALAEAGELAARADRLQLAGSYFLRAGRSAAQRKEPQAMDWLEQARALGSRSGDQALVGEAEAAIIGLRETAD